MAPTSFRGGLFPNSVLTPPPSQVSDTTVTLRWDPPLGTNAGSMFQPQASAFAFSTGSLAPPQYSARAGVSSDWFSCIPQLVEVFPTLGLGVSNTSVWCVQHFGCVSNTWVCPIHKRGGHVPTGGVGVRVLDWLARAASKLGQGRCVQHVAWVCPTIGVGVSDTSFGCVQHFGCVPNT